MSKQINPEFNKAIEGKTVFNVDYSSVNTIRISFTDGSYVDVWAECGSGPFDIPFFDITLK